MGFIPDSEQNLNLCFIKNLNRQLSLLIGFQIEKRQYLPHCWLNKGFKVPLSIRKSSKVTAIVFFKFSVQCSVFRFYCLVLSVQCSVFSVHCSLFIVQCSVFSVQFSLFSVQCSVFSVHCLLFSVQCSVFSVHCSLFIVQCSFSFFSIINYRCKSVTSVFAGSATLNYAHSPFKSIRTASYRCNSTAN